MELWFVEKETEHIKVHWKVKRTVDSRRSQFQQVDIVEFEQFGRGLVLDGIIQTTLADEFIYHEMLAHVPLATHPGPRRVLVVGGGDGGTVREVLKHPVQSVDLVEIDGVVVDLCRKHLPELAGCLDDKRVKVNIQDGIEFIRQRQNYYDCVLVDSSDPIGPAVGLFARDFYRDVRNALKDDGLMAAQTESPLFNRDLVSQVNAGVKQLFEHRAFYWCNVPTYSIGPWSFVLASKRHTPGELKGHVPAGCRYWNRNIHRAAFVLPGYFQELVQ